MMRKSLIGRFGPAAAILAFAACDNSGADLGFSETPKRTIVADVFLDRDGSRSRTALDTAYTGARVVLLQRGSRDTIFALATDNRGFSTFENVPIGEYTVTVAGGSLGDTVEVAAVDSANLVIRPQDATTGVVIRLTYPEFSIRRARAAASGKPIFLRGVILAGVQSFRDTTSHLSDSSGTIRLTGVALRGGLAGNSPGDSVSVLGIVGVRLDQPVLDQALISRFGSRPAPLPTIVTTAVATTADAGKLDAGLVQVISATITDTASALPDYSITVNDGSGPLLIVLDANLQFPRTAFIPGRQVTARGVLVPKVGGGWLFKPRDLGDVTIF